MLEVVTLTKEAWSALRAHAEAAFPEECVGALLRDGTVRTLTNAASDRRAGFLVSARETISLLSSAEVLGYYHSHPNGAAAPSSEDAAQASEGMITLIIPVMDGVASAPRAFRFSDGKFLEERVHHESSESLVRDR